MRTYWQSVGENLWLALDTLRTHMLRSLLTLLGVFIGTLTVIAVASIILASMHNWLRQPNNMARESSGSTNSRWACPTD